MNAVEKSGSGEAGELCLSCGLCCNGVIFARLKLQPEDDARRLQQLGLPLAGLGKTGGRAVLVQPCAAFDGCRCEIYAERPKHCREFECLLLQDVKTGRITMKAALKTVKGARRRVAKVKGLLSDMGETDKRTALSVRFRRTAKRLEKTTADHATVGRFGELTVAMHELNLLLSEKFYP